ncbi:MAG: SLC13 family permease [Minwuia sp.]|uniref:SLC13 family permease n=1 Tax=Minwuia sp. TaxID=2493630 RepID=UPI003A8B50C7
MAPVEPTLHMWLVLAVVGLAVFAYVSERLSIELVSLLVIASLAALFDLLPYESTPGLPEITLRSLLAGLADPALITVLSLMIIGQGMIRTGALDAPIRQMAKLRRYHPFLAVFAGLVVVAVTSGLLNNTPVVVIFIPIMVALASRLRRSPSGLMIPLSYAAILGGMTTLIGSSTNLLVSASAANAGAAPLGFFDFTITGSILAGVGLVYVIFVAPRLLPDRASYAQSLTEGAAGKQFIAQIDVRQGSQLVGERAKLGLFPSLPGITVRLIQRGDQSELPPFDDVKLQPGDKLVVAATRASITEAISRMPSLIQALHTSEDIEQPASSDHAMDRDFILAEVVIAPASRVIGRNLEQIAFHSRTGCTVIGIQRRSRMIRQGIQDIRLEAGDVLLLLGHRSDVRRLRGVRDVILMEWSAHDLPAVELAWRSSAIFAATVTASATGVVPIVVASLLGAAAMLIANCLNVRQAVRSLDLKVAMLIWSALAMGTALHGTGGATWIAQSMMSLMSGAPPIAILSIFFLLVAAMTNVLSNNATAVLFTPIGIGLAQSLGVEPEVFVLATLFGANCSFATPMGYQTNLLVMGPGHYRFSDYARAGVPLILIVWVTYTLVAMVRYDL